MNVKYYHFGEDDGKGYWDSTKNMKDGTPIITSARQFTDYCTKLRLRHNMLDRLKALMDNEAPFSTWNKEATHKFLEEVDRGK